MADWGSRAEIRVLYSRDCAQEDPRESDGTRCREVALFFLKVGGFVMRSPYRFFFTGK